jgi:photosystem II stability/assembly factor-like uncharacterized protein
MLFSTGGFMRVYLILVITFIAVFSTEILYCQSGWTAQTSNTSNTLTGVSFADANNGWAVGASATIRHTTDGGATWGTQTSPVNQLLRSVFAIDANTAVAAGDNGLIIRTTDGGANWTQVTSGTTNPLTSVYFASTTTGWIVGGLGTSATIKASSTGGASFGTQTTTASGIFRAVAVASTSIVTAFGGTSDNLFQIRARSTNGGTNWTTQVQGTINGVIYGAAYGTSTVGIAAGAGGLVYKTTDAGSNWGAATSPTSNILYGVAMKDANTGWVVGTFGELFKTTDAGSNWITQSGVTSSTLFGVSFSDLYNGTAVGQNGTIVHTTTGGVVSNISASKTGDYTGGFISPGATDVPILQISLSNSDGTARVTGLSTSFTSTATAVDGDISAVKAYYDADNSGTVTGGDVLLGSNTFSSGVATWTGLTLDVTSVITKILFVVDIAVGANTSHTLGLELTNSSCITASNATSSGFPISNTSNSPLPVELKDFSANTESFNVILRWSTASEINNHGFEIEKRKIQDTEFSISKEGAQWISSGFVAGAGTSSAPRTYLYLDKNLSAGKYAYRLKQIDRDGKLAFSHSVVVDLVVVPSQFVLSQNYPNPFNPTTNIRFAIPVSAFVSLKVYDLIGREVATLVNEQRKEGFYTVQFNASTLSSGGYFYRLQTGNFVETKKLLLQK